MTAEHAAHLKRVQELKREVGRLKDDPSAVERVAREELGYVAKGELVLVLPADDTTPAAKAKLGKP